MESIRVLVVDDSTVFRMLVHRALQTLPGVVVQATCRDGEAALERLRLDPPDLVTMDFEMPRKDGMQALREIMALNREKGHKIQVVMLSTHSKAGADITLQALEAGAMDFIPKPLEGSAEDNFSALVEALSSVVETVRQMRPTPSPPKAPAASRPAFPNTNASAKPSPVLGSRSATAPRNPGSRFPVGPPTAGETTGRKAPPFTPRAIFIGVSTGGPVALAALLPELTRNLSLPVVVVQHMPPKFTQSLAESLDRKCSCPVVEASHGQSVHGPGVYIAPGGRHMEIRRGAGGPEIALHDAAPENGCRPAVDVLFRSALTAFDGHVIAVILTGMGSDGAASLPALATRGTWIITQDQQSSVVWGMPGSAMATGKVDQLLPLAEIASAVHRLLRSS